LANSVAPGSTPRSRVLVVEDEFLIAAMVQDMLSDLGYDCLGPLVTLEAGVAAATTEQFEAAIINLVIQGRHSWPRGAFPSASPAVSTNGTSPNNGGIARSSLSHIRWPTCGISCSAYRRSH
jgi:hypothetical protein